MLSYVHASGSKKNVHAVTEIKYVVTKSIRPTKVDLETCKPLWQH